MINSLLTAFSVLTILPVKTLHFDKPEECVKFFPVVGMALYIVPISMFYSFVYLNQDPFFASILSILFVTFLTGGLHIDGLADVLDGFGGAKEKNQTLKIFKDSCLGSFGVIGVSFDIIIKSYVYYKCFSNGIIYPIVLSLVLGRISQGIFLMFLPNINPNGIAKSFHIKKKSTKLTTAAFYLSFILFLGLFINFKIVAIVLGLMTAVSLSFGLLCYKRLVGINGDCLGALNEFVECSILLTFLL